MAHPIFPDLIGHLGRPLTEDERSLIGRQGIKWFIRYGESQDIRPAMSHALGGKPLSQWIEEAGYTFHVDDYQAVWSEDIIEASDALKIKQARRPQC